MRWPLALALLSILLVAPSRAAEKSTAPQLIALAKSNSPLLRDAILATFDPKDLASGTAWTSKDRASAPES
jgi:uncharacterized membrane protein (DUF4010 family)